jgi:GTPase SAR1 family protein
MEITLIIGDSDQGKSTLVRSLTGKSRDRHQHQHHKNLVSLDWISANSSPQTHDTLVLISSLNEGTKYTNVGVKAYRNLAGVAAVHPDDLEDMLDDYDSLGNPLPKAILCISTSVSTRDWKLAEYHLAMINGSFPSKHPVTKVVHVGRVTVGRALAWPNPMVPRHALAPIIVPGPLVAANTVAQAARAPIGLV